MSRVLFVMLHPGFIRYYEGALHALAAGGHHVHVAFEVSRTKLGEDVTARRLAESSPNITCGTAPERAESVREFLARSDRGAMRSGAFRGRADRAAAWESLATTVRLSLDYLRFFEPVFATAVHLRARAEKRLPRIQAAAIRALARCGAAVRRALAAVLGGLEQIIPTPPAIDAFIRDQHPDVVLVTPLIELGSQQVDYVKSARKLGVRSALCVASWDNLTSKGLVRVVPDHVVVWNEAQRREAVELHGVPRERVTVTGAQVFDRWFGAAPSRTREEFCRAVGLDPSRPYVLYVGSSSFIAPDEVPFADEWIATIRASDDPAVSGLGVLVRPHPANARQWRAFDAAAHAGVAVWPPIGVDPNAPDFHRDYFESLFFSEAVVGINTSALIEAGIVGRPVFTIRAPGFAHAQEGTLHFGHLVNDHGLVRAAASFDEHVEQLRRARAGVADVGGAAREFVGAFVRPRGLDTAVAPLFADAVSGMTMLPPPASRPDAVWRRVLRPGAFLLALAARGLADDRPIWAYALRPAVRAAVLGASAGYRVRGLADGARLGLKRARRLAWRVLYEAMRGVDRRVRRLRKPIARFVRTAGGAARRLSRRGL